MKTTITSNDLNGIDYLNGTSSVATKGGNPVVNNNGETLTGSLGKYNASVMNSKINSEMSFIFNIRHQIHIYQMEQIEYNNLPAGLNKYRIEQKLIENGFCGIIEVNNIFYCVSITFKDFNIYNEPTSVVVVEPKSELLNGKEFTIGKDIFLIRNDLYKTPTYNKVWTYISKMEKILYQLEKNLLASAPKGILNLKNGVLDTPTDNPNERSLEQIITSENTFHSYTGGGDFKPENLNEENLYIPIELRDRTDELITNYSFFKEQVKEMIGAGHNLLNGKKERLITGEVDSQQDLSNSTIDHMINIRNNDWKEINEYYGINVSIKLGITYIEEKEEDNNTGEENV